MDVNVLIGCSVMHGGFMGFGKGTIVAVDGNVVSIEFNCGVKKFPIDKLNQFLTFDDEISEVVQQIVHDIEEANILAETVKRANEAAAKSAKEAAAKRAGIVGGLGPNYHAEYLKTDEVYTYQQVETKFGIHIAGFGRGCNSTENDVVLISSVNHTEDHFVYHDKFDVNGDYIFSGEGKVGNQTMTRGNLIIRDAEENGKVIHLFVKFSSQEYYYQGIFKLVDYTCEQELDEEGNTRWEYKFRLRRI